MWDYISERVVKEAEYIIETGTTVRAAAAHFSISKSTVHKDVTERLRLVDKELFEQVRGVLDTNLSERHIRGGLATKKKYCGASGCAGGEEEVCAKSCAGDGEEGCATDCASDCPSCCACGGDENCATCCAGGGSAGDGCAEDCEVACASDGEGE